MHFNIARLMRGIISLAAYSLPLVLLILSACGGGGGGGGGTLFSPGPSPAGGVGIMVSTFAGTANPGADGIGAAARFKGDYSSVSDGFNLYVADSVNNVIRKIVISTGAVTTLAGKTGVAGAADGTGTTATFNLPSGITIDSTNTNLYVADSGNNKIRQVSISSGAVTSFTGAPNSVVAAGAADGAATAASFNSPRGITNDGTTLYVADTGNNKIRMVVIATGTVSSRTGATNAAVPAGAVDSLSFPLLVSFNAPTGIALDSTKTVLYVADAGNNKIRQVVISTGAVSSFTGTTSAAVTAGAVEGPAASASFNSPSGIAADSVNLYVADSSNNKIRQIVIATGAVSSLTGAPGVPGTVGFADGVTASAMFSSPRGITVAGGNLYVADYSNGTVRKIAGGLVSTPAGNADPGADGTGAAARFNLPGNIVSDGTNLYVADALNNTIRKIVIATGAVTTLAGSPAYLAGAADGPGTAATFSGPYGLATDGTNLYVADTGNNKIRKVVIANGSVSSLTGASGFAVTAGAADGPGTAATFSGPYGLTTDGTNLYVADTGNNKIRKVVIATGSVSSLTGATGVAVTAGAVDGVAAAVSFASPVGIIIDSGKTNLYVADQLNNKIRQVAIPGGAASSVTGVSGIGSAVGAADGAAPVATFNRPFGITTDGTSLFVAEYANNKIRQIVIPTGAVSSLTGVTNTAGGAGFADGTLAAATFNKPNGITVVGTTLYITDSANNTIRRIQ